MSETKAETIAKAASLIRTGGIVAFPTETVYGLGADATNEAAVRRVFNVKGRPPSNPLIIHVTGTEAAARLAPLPRLAEQLAERFWPGPLTLVLERHADSGLSPLTTAGLPTVALRAPAHPIARELLRQVGCPIAAPSANRSGRVSPTCAEHVRAQLGDAVDLIVDGGPCPLGLESTVLDLSGPAPTILRPGGATQEALEEIIGPLIDPEATALRRSPGTQNQRRRSRIPGWGAGLEIGKKANAIAVVERGTVDHSNGFDWNNTYSRKEIFVFSPRRDSRMQ